jgi:transposase
MLSFTGSLKVFLAAQPADLRKGFSGLYAMTAQVLREDPQSGALFVFTNRDRTRIKSLYWDGTGLWVMTKRLEKGRFSWPEADGGKVELKPGELALLLDGIELKNVVRKSWFRRG